MLNSHDQLAQSKRLRALLRLAEAKLETANLETTAARSAAPASGLPWSMFHAIGIHDEVLDGLAADGFIERGGGHSRGASGGRPRASSRKPASKHDSSLVLTASAAALLFHWLAHGMSFALPTSVHGLQLPPRTHRAAGGETAQHRSAAAERPATSRFPAAIAPRATHFVVPRPTWDRRAGDLRWQDELALHLAGHASVQADILDEFERLDFNWVVRSPLAPETLGDKTAPKRHAVNELNERQGNTPMIHFASLHGRFICWCPAEWLATDR
ncbi:MAG TPA: hypothetical protein VND64_02475 [Pirellulales bacterium]|nr:hypothetical protein [Pirellulales bacterium]